MATYWTDGRFLETDRGSVTTVVTDGGFIRAVGGAELLDGASPGDGIERLDGFVVTPGLWDSHLHLEEMARRHLQVDLEGLDTLEEVVERVGHVRPQVGDWVLGAGWNHNRWGGRLLHRRDLDGLGRRPVLLDAHGEHIACVNTEALRRVGWWPHPPSHLRELVDVDREGPTGILREAAAGAFRALVPDVPPEEWRRGADRAAAELTAMGLVGATDMCRLTDRGFLPLAAWNHERHALRLHLFVADPPDVHLSSEELMGRAEAALCGGDGWWTRLLGRKLWLDGMLGSRTAWMLDPYEDDPGRGIPFWSDDVLDDDVSWLGAHGWSAALHAIGDAAVRQALGVLERTTAAPAAAIRRVEHAQIIHPEDIARFRRVAAAASMQPVHILQDRLAAPAALADRSRRAFPLRVLLDSGTPVALGSDAPVETPDPVIGMWSAVWRSAPGEEPWHPEQALTPEEALVASTRTPAALDHRPGGRIAPGLLADFTLFDRDPLDALRRREPFRVMATVRDGAFVHRSF